MMVNELIIALNKIPNPEKVIVDADFKTWHGEYYSDNLEVEFDGMYLTFKEAKNK